MCHIIYKDINNFGDSINCAILARHNEDTKKLNKNVLGMLNGEVRTYCNNN